MRKKNLLFLLLVFVFAIAIFWQPITNTLLHTGLNYYCSNWLGCKLNASKIYRDNHRWVVDQPSIIKDGMMFQAERFIIESAWNFSKQELNFSVVVDKPKLHFDEKASNVKEVLGSCFPSTQNASLGPFKICCSLAVNEGRIYFGDEKKQHVALFHTYFAWDQFRQEAKVALKLDDQDFENNLFHIVLQKKENDPLLTEMMFHNVNGHKIGALLEGIGCSLKGWHINDGVVHGMISSKGGSSHKSLVWGELDIQNLRFENRKINMEGTVKNARLHLESDENSKEISFIKGSININDEASLLISREGQPYWEIKNLLGGISLNENEEIELSFKGECRQETQTFDLAVSGKAILSKQEASLIDVMVNLQNSNKKNAMVCLKSKPLNKRYNCVEVVFSNIGEQEFAFVQTAIEGYFPSCNIIHVHEGTIDASGVIFLQGFKASLIRIDKILAKNIKFDLGPGDLAISTEESLGTFSINLSAKNIFETIDSDFSIKRAQAQFRGLDGKLWKFKDLRTHLAVRKGIVQKSEMQGEFAGLKGTILLDWLSTDEIAKLLFRGEAKEIIEISPEVFKSGLEKAFKNYQVMLSAGMKWKPEGVKVEGEIIFSSSESEENKINFGFSLEKSSEKLWKRWPASVTARSYWENVGLEAMQSMIPPIASPTILMQSNWLNTESGIAGLVMRYGWFSAQNVPLEKFVSPILFSYNQIRIYGKGNFQGKFDHSKLAIRYTCNDIALESANFTISSPKNLENVFAVHHFDFAKKIHFGTFPLKNCTYFEKNSGLLFTDINASVNFEGRKVHVSEIETKCNGVYLAGGLKVNFSPDEESYTVEINNRTIKGKVSEVQHLLQHFKKDIFLKIPLEGDISYTDQGGWIHFLFHPKSYQVKAILQGSITHAELPINEENMSLKDLKIDFYYDHEQSFLNFSNIQGSFQLKGPESLEYRLIGDHIRFDNLWNGIASFDLWLGDHTRDMVRLAGRTNPLPLKDGERGHMIEFYIDPTLTHFGDIHPAEFKLVLKNWTEIEIFQTAFQLKLNTLFHDFQHFMRLSLISFSRRSAKDFDKNIKNAFGNLKVNLSYFKKTSEFAYHLHGENITFGNFVCNNCTLEGTKIGEEWRVEELRVDDIWARGVFEKKDNNWKVNPFQFKHYKSLSMELEGTFFPKENILKAYAKNIELDLAELHEWSDLRQLVEDCSPHGKMTASGDMNIVFTRGSPSIVVEASLKSFFSSWDFKGLRFSNTKKFSCHFVSNKRITIQNLQTSLQSWDSVNPHAEVQLEKISYGFTNGELQLQRVHFDLPAQHLPWLAESLTRSFPSFIGPNISNVIRNLKTEGKIKGSFNFEFNPPYTAMRLNLADGCYRYLDSEHDLRNFRLESDPYEFKLSAQYMWGNYPFWFRVRSMSPTLEEGDLVVKEVEQLNPNEGLFIKWRNNSNKDLSIKQIQGTLAGLSINLLEDALECSNKTIALEGEIAINAGKASTFCSADLASKIIGWQLGCGYVLRGKWKYLNDAHLSFSDQLYFMGALEGQNIEMKGFQFDNLQAKIHYSPQEIKVTDLIIEDMAGMMSISQLEVNKGTDKKWYFTLPSMNIKRLRPSLLREKAMTRSHFYKPFVITDIVLDGCYGCIEDSLSVVGKGILHFSNRSKKLFHNTIFHIPAEILSRIGLDLSVLTPTGGTINYSIANGKIYFTKFKDIYSEGKLSKFYLPNGATNSYMDFDGNLNVQVKMKQYNLLFKLAELFTVTIQGNVQKPTYTLQKQHRIEQFTSR
jgi:hypothetical protein